MAGPVRPLWNHAPEKACRTPPKAVMEQVLGCEEGNPGPRPRFHHPWERASPQGWNPQTSHPRAWHRCYLSDTPLPESQGPTPWPSSTSPATHTNTPHAHPTPTHPSHRPPGASLPWRCIICLFSASPQKDLSSKQAVTLSVYHQFLARVHRADAP